MALIDILANDADVGPTPTVNVVSQPARGTVSVVDQGLPSAKILWTDNGSGAGSTSFQYSVTSAGGTSAAATVTLTINQLELPSFIDVGTGDARTNPANDLTPTYPGAGSPGLAAGDLLLANIVIHADASQACATPSGWALVASRVEGDLGNFLFAKTAVGSESGTQAFNWDGVSASSPSTFPVGTGAIYRFRPFQSGACMLDAAVTAGGTGATASFPALPIAGTNRLAVAFVASNRNSNQTTNPTGETGGDWQHAAVGWGTSSGDDASTNCFTARMPLEPLISGGTVALANSPDRWSIIAVTISDIPAAGLYVALTGDDTTGDGSFANPWGTIAKGMAEVQPGERLNLRGGTYRLTSGFSWTKSGTLAARVTLASHPGEVAVIDANIAAFQTTGVGAWTLHDAGTATYRSAAGYSIPTAWIGSAVIASKLYRLMRYGTLTGLMSTTYTWREDGEFYRGPGFVLHSDGRFYVRLQNLASPRDAGVPAAAPAGAAIRNTPASDFDPNNYRIDLSNIANMWETAASNVTFERLEFRGGDRGPNQNTRSNVTYQNCRIWGQRINIRLDPNNTNIQVLGCDFDNGVPPWISWNEIKRDDGNHPGMKMSLCTCDENNGDILFQDNRIRSAFDGMATLRGTSNNNRFLNNTFDFLFDDAVQFDGGTTNFEFGYNYVVGPGPGYNGGGSEAAATKYFHHNVLDVRRDEFGWRTGHNGDGSQWRESHTAFPGHSVETSDTPAKVYCNTILYGLNIANDGSRLERHGIATLGLHEARNNLVVGYGSHSYIRNPGTSTARAQYDYNLMWETSAYTAGWGRDYPGGHYASLAAWLASGDFNGWEANSKQIDPVLGDPDAGDYRPTAAGALTGAQDLSLTGWPGATNAAYFGAVDPSAATGLGGVGARGTPGP